MSNGQPSPYENPDVRRTGPASLAALDSPATRRTIEQVARLEQEGARVSPVLRMLAGYAEGYRNAAANQEDN
ncbi:hypothetical protein [Demequina capsici]|uniref:Uncharacterized protein n=1 Tax=Demequina capsici TaxID=3075620 RepID=A0AA96FBQ8_9MICO|nr:hypothetical protein [Demequina sp. OYTSA14]WNM25646.1 hypothetical protein RN606_05715 [Demequina sp. OYTSA14]